MYKVFTITIGSYLMKVGVCGENDTLFLTGYLGRKSWGEGYVVVKEYIYIKQHTPHFITADYPRLLKVWPYSQ